MTSKIRLALAAVVVGALAVATAAPAAAQETPTLGFEIDRTEGAPGDQVAGQVAVDDVAAHCITTTEALQQEIAAWVEGTLGVVDGELFQAFFPGQDFIPIGELENYDQAVYAALALLSLAVAFDIEGATQTLLDQTFAMTFADPGTQAPVGQRASFDPAVGQATVTVPEVTPGLWAIAATCVFPTSDVPALIAGIRSGGAYLEGLGIPVNDLPLNLADAEGLAAFLEEHGAALLESIIEPQALGVQLFCVLDAEGRCPGDAPPAGEPPTAKPAQPVRAAPTFTG